MLYGPVYFIIQKFILKIIGFGVFQFRLFNFLCGLAIIPILRKLIKDSISLKVQLYIFIAILLEPVFQRNLHSGRMDFLALVFLFTAYIFYFKIEKSDNKKILSIAVGVLLALATLTTPRIIFGFVFFVIDAILNVKKRERLLQYFIIFLSFALIYSIWIFVKFNSLNQFIFTYTNNDLIKEHLGADRSIFLRYNYHILLWVLLVISCIFLLKIWKKLPQKSKQLARLSIINIIVFHFAIAERGPYTAMVIAFYLVIIGIAFNYLLKQNNSIKWSVTFYTIIVFPFAAIFSIKAVSIIKTFNDRNPYTIEKEISNIIPKDKKVIGTFDYYFACINNQNNFEEFEYCIDFDKMFYHQTNEFKYEYLIVREDFCNLPITQKYLASNKHILVATIGTKPATQGFNNWLDQYIYKLLDTHIISSYYGKIYKRID